MLVDAAELLKGVAAIESEWGEYITKGKVICLIADLMYPEKEKNNWNATVAIGDTATQDYSYTKYTYNGTVCKND